MVQKFDSLVFLFSGQKTENPLLLLGQYSDDEVEEDSKERADDATADSSVANKNQQVTIINLYKTEYWWFLC